ncbi:AAA family ATPase [Providencia rettgeri]|uniref:AAA family ATPase n=1 Tax=Providencia rettgeri TaxID=587 RepID=UPI001B371CAB|nr:AAA family ATPase [Providencia rettgeri]ELY3855373.1 AAA family ATPase [Providencia rettgeri]MBQ0366056.1 AAA family ATPase [Providencia rettgeri]
MLRLKEVMKEHQISQQILATAAGISQPAIAQLVNHGKWPKQHTEQVRQRICDFLDNHELDSAEVFNEVSPQTNDCDTSAPDSTKSEDETMLLAKQVLLPATKKHFGLFRDPFSDEALQGAEDVFVTPDIRYVREALYQTARYGGFLAVIGESGAGKSTLRRDLIDRINRENDPIIVIEPYIIAMEDNDIKGKTLKAGSIAEAIINTITPLENVKRSQEARYRQLHRVLKDSSNAGYQHVLVIEEAHALPIPTLKHLKRFYELENGFKKLLSIVLIGQPELSLKLSERNQAVREVVQRCEVVQLPPLDNQLNEFLTFKFGRTGKPINEVLTDCAIEAIRNRLSQVKSGRREAVSLLYPLAVSNLIIAGMNLAAQIGVPVVDADVIKGV